MPSILSVFSITMQDCRHDDLHCRSSCVKLAGQMQPACFDVANKLQRCQVLYCVKSIISSTAHLMKTKYMYVGFAVLDYSKLH